jgi:hypothetical protein
VFASDTRSIDHVAVTARDVQEQHCQHRVRLVNTAAAVAEEWMRHRPADGLPEVVIESRLFTPSDGKAHVLVEFKRFVESFIVQPGLHPIQN